MDVSQRGVGEIILGVFSFFVSHFPPLSVDLCVTKREPLISQSTPTTDQVCVQRPSETKFLVQKICLVNEQWQYGRLDKGPSSAPLPMRYLRGHLGNTAFHTHIKSGLMVSFETKNIKIQTHIFFSTAIRGLCPIFRRVT